MVGSNPPEITIEVEESPYDLIIKIFYPIKQVKKIALSEKENMDSPTKLSPALNLGVLRDMRVSDM